jgi:hypothetical protein
VTLQDLSVEGGPIDIGTRSTPRRIGRSTTDQPRPAYGRSRHGALVYSSPTHQFLECVPNDFRTVQPLDHREYGIQSGSFQFATTILNKWTLWRANVSVEILYIGLDLFQALLDDVADANDAAKCSIVNYGQMSDALERHHLHQID